MITQNESAVKQKETQFLDREQQTYQALLELVAEANQYPGSSAIAERIGLSPKTKAQVTVYLKRLVDKKLVVQVGKMYLPVVCVEAAKERSENGSQESISDGR